MVKTFTRILISVFIAASGIQDTQAAQRSNHRQQRPSKIQQFRNSNAFAPIQTEVRDYPSSLNYGAGGSGPAGH